MSGSLVATASGVAYPPGFKVMFNIYCTDLATSQRLLARLGLNLFMTRLFRILSSLHAPACRGGAFIRCL